jgi:hypothetical protein
MSIKLSLVVLGVPKIPYLWNITENRTTKAWHQRAPLFFKYSPHIASSSVHLTSLVLKRKWVLLHEVMSLSIMVCITLIFEALEHVLNPYSFHDVCLEIMLFALFKPGRVTQCPSKLISLSDGLLLGGSLKSHRLTFPPYLPLSIFIPCISFWALGLATLGRVAPYLVGRRG